MTAAHEGSAEFSEAVAYLGDTCACLAYDAEDGADTAVWMPCPHSKCERPDHASVKSVITRYTKEKYPSEASGLLGRIPELQGFTDDEISVLCEMVQHEGIERGFGSYWYE